MLLVQWVEEFWSWNFFLDVEVILWMCSDDELEMQGEEIVIIESRFFVKISYKIGNNDIVYKLLVG